jgi:yecA family protein
MSNLLNAPERGAIEIFLLRQKPADGQAPTFERLLGFLSGVVITPGGITPSDWMQPLLEFNAIVFNDTDDATQFMDQLMPLYNRLNDMRLRNENLCPFDWREMTDLDKAHQQASDWGIGLHDALRLRPGIWAPEKHEARHVPAKLLEEMQHTMAFIWAIADPGSVPHIVPDPVPFQRNFLSRAPGWKEEMIRHSWDDELVEMFRLLCLSRLSSSTEVLQRYAKAYDVGTRAGSRKPQAPPAKVRVGRNDPCPCGSGVKYKKCCGR